MAIVLEVLLGYLYYYGGGIGWGEVENGGFGMVLDSRIEAEHRLKSMLFWDVNNEIARRGWARNDGAIFAAKRAMEAEPQFKSYTS